MTKRRAVHSNLYRDHAPNLKLTNGNRKFGSDYVIRWMAWSTMKLLFVFSFAGLIQLLFTPL